MSTIRISSAPLFASRPIEDWMRGFAGRGRCGRARESAWRIAASSRKPSLTATSSMLRIQPGAPRASRPRRFVSIRR